MMYFKHNYTVSLMQSGTRPYLFYQETAGKNGDSTKGGKIPLYAEPRHLNKALVVPHVKQTNNKQTTTIYDRGKGCAGKDGRVARDGSSRPGAVQEGRRGS